MKTWLIILLTLFAVFCWAQWVEPNWYRIRRLRVCVRKPLKRPLSILHLTDLHLTKPRYWIERFFDRLAQLEVDFVFLTGDLIDRPEGIEVLKTQLQKLRPKQGIYAVLGNHDYHRYVPFEPFLWVLTKWHYSHPRPKEVTERLKQALRETGVRILANENVSVSLGNDQELVLVGVDDPVTKRANVRQAFRGIENGVLRFGLVHSPVIFPSLGKRGIDVAFAGHTHGGQIRLPKLGPLLHWVRRIEPIIDSTNKYGFVGLVSQGMGAQPKASLRFWCRPEALLVTLEGSS